MSTLDEESTWSVTRRIMKQMDRMDFPRQAALFAPAGYRMAVANQICKEQGKTSRFYAIGLVFGMIGTTSMELASYLSHLSYMPLARQFLSDVLELAKAEERGYVYEYNEPSPGVEYDWLGSAADYENYDENGEYHDEDDEEMRSQVLAAVEAEMAAGRVPEKKILGDDYFDDQLGKMESAVQPLEPAAIADEVGHGEMRIRVTTAIEVAEVLPGSDCLLEEVMRGWARYQADDVGLTMLMDGKEVNETKFLGFLSVYGATGVYPDDETVAAMTDKYRQMGIGRLRLPATKDDIIEAVLASPQALQPVHRFPGRTL